MKKRAKRRREEEDDVLCCCEYVNTQGERSHVAACCCDCQDLDDAFDRFLKKEPQKPESLWKVSEVVSDRIRVPWLWGGARKLDLSIIPPLIVLPVVLRVAALHFLLGVVSLLALPVLVLWFYYFTHRKKGHTLFFLSLALFSLLYMYYVFLTEVFPRGDVSVLQLSGVTVGLLLTLTALIHSKRGPGFVLQHQEDVHSTVTYYSPLTDRDSAVHEGKHQVTVTVNSRLPSAELEEVKEVKEMKESRSWCAVCRLLRPPRAGHCRICGVCVLRLDHHCVWINSCVGQENHLSFLLTLVFFVWTSVYGISLVLQSVCPSRHLLTALLYCPEVYHHYSTALSFTCAWYCSVVTVALLHLLLLQLVNISFNVTEREARAALRDKTSRRALWGLVVDTGVYSRGFCHNWTEFITMRGRVHSDSAPHTHMV